MTIRDSLTRTVPPSVALISTDDAKRQCRVDDTDEEVVIKALVAAVTSYVDGADGCLGRALISQTWAYRLAKFPEAIKVPLPPLISVDSVAYVDGDGVSQTLSSSLYQVVVGGYRHALIVPAYGQAWPSIRDQMDAVTVTFTAGYGAAAANVPAGIVQACKMILAHWYDHRGSDADDIPDPARRLLSRFEISYF